MRDLSIDEREELEDIEIATDREYFIAENEERDFYFPIKDVLYSQLIFNKKGDKYILDVCNNGFLVENPDILSFYKGKEFSKDEFIDFLKDLGKTIVPILQNKRVESYLNFFNHKTFRLLGVNLRGRASLDDEYDKMVKNKEVDIILYLKDSSSKVYRMVLMNLYGMCGSGWTTATWGEVNVSVCENLPDTFHYVPLEEIDTEITIHSKYSENETVEISFETMEDILGIIYCCFDGGDSYYPSGYVEDNIGFLNIESDKLARFFSRDLDSISKILKREERIPISEPDYDEE